MGILHLTYNIFDVSKKFVKSTNCIWKDIEKLKHEFLFEYGSTFGLTKIKHDNPGMYNYSSYSYQKYRYVISHMWSDNVYVSHHHYVIVDGFGRIVKPSVLFEAYEKEFGEIKYKFYHTVSTYRGFAIRGRCSNADRGERRHAHGRTKLQSNISTVKREIASCYELQYYSNKYMYVNTTSKPSIPCWNEKTHQSQKNWKKYRLAQYKANNGKD
jgi:hypothetical protein